MKQLFYSCEAKCTDVKKKNCCRDANNDNICAKLQLVACNAVKHSTVGKIRSLSDLDQIPNLVQFKIQPKINKFAQVLR